MMSYLLNLSIIILVSITVCLTLEFDELNICDTQTRITVKHSFRFQDKFVAFVKINSSDTVYAIKVNGFQSSVTYHRNYENYTFELSGSNSAEIWNDWNVNVNDHVEEDLENFEDVFVREDPLVHNVVVYLKSGRYYKTEYDSNFTRIKFVNYSHIEDSGDDLQRAINGYVTITLGRDPERLTALRFPRDVHRLFDCALVYLKTSNQYRYVVNWLTNNTRNKYKWDTYNETLDLDSSDSTKIVSAFYITNYALFELNSSRRHFFMIEISSSGGFNVKRMIIDVQIYREVIKIDLKPDSVYNRTIRQLFQCPLLTTSSTTTTISDKTPLVVIPVEKTSLNPFRSSANTMSTEMSTNTVPKNNKWLYIITAIILLLIITAAILGIWCCCCRRNKKSEESEENGPEENEKQLKSLAEEKETIRSDTDVDSSDTAIPSQTESEGNPSGVSQQSQSQSPKDV